MRGGIYGPEMTSDQMGPGRFPKGTCGVEGLFLAGAGIKGGNVRLALTTGIHAGRRALAFLKAG